MEVKARKHSGCPPLYDIEYCLFFHLGYCFSTLAPQITVSKGVQVCERLGLGLSA